MNINARGLHFKDLNAQIRAAQARDIVVENCLGQRYIGSGLAGKNVVINGLPGNALGAYLDGSTITVYGNTQEATGDTMNEGEIVIFGNAGDATGIHMKEYQDKIPVVVIGGRVGSFLGEYQAGGVIVVLGIGQGGQLPVGYFTGTGMHGGKILLRSDFEPEGLPPQVICREATAEDKQAVLEFVEGYCQHFGGEAAQLLCSALELQDSRHTSWLPWK